MAPTILAATDKSGSNKAIVGEGAFQYEVTHGWGELPSHVRWGETHGVCFDKVGNIYVAEWVPTGRVSFLRHVS